MARFARGAKCGNPGSPPTRVPSALAESGSSDARAAVPRPSAPAWKKCRRVIARRCSWMGCIALLSLHESECLVDSYKLAAPPSACGCGASRRYFGNRDGRWRMITSALLDELVHQRPEVFHGFRFV